MAVNDDILNRQILHLVSLQRQYNSLDRNVQRQLTAHGQAINDIIRSNANLNTKISRLRTQITRSYQGINETVMDNITRVGTNETNFQRNNLQRSMGNLYTVKGASNRTFRSQIRNASLTTNLSTITGSRSFEDWLNGISAREFRTVQASIRSGFVEGLSPEQIISNTANTLNRSRSSTRTLVRTIYTYSQNMASDLVYAQNSDVLRGYEWLSTLDNRTSGVCRGRDGKMYETGSNVFPPAHFNCRSTTIPIVKSLEDLPVPQSRKDRLSGRRRASFTGQVPAELDYDSWLRGQPRDIQDEILGTAQAAIFAGGKLHISKFTNIYGQDISMNRLQDLDANVIKSSTYGSQYQRGQDVTQFDLVQPVVNVNNLLDYQDEVARFIGANAYIANINKGQLNFASVNFTNAYRAHLKQNDGTIFRGSRRNRVNNEAWALELELLDEAALPRETFRFISGLLSELRTTLRGNQRIVAIRTLRRLYERNNFNPDLENINQYLRSRLNYEARLITRKYLLEYQ